MTTLKLDFDRPAFPARLRWRAAWLCRRCGWRLVAISFTRSTNRGWHAEVVVTGRLAPVEQVAAQAILGSHWAREGHNLMRTRALARVRGPMRQRWNVLYTRKVRVRG